MLRRVSTGAARKPCPGPAAWGCMVAAVFFLVCMSADVQGADSESGKFCISPESLYEFAEKNYKSGDYLAAAIEFKRFSHFFPDHPRAAEAGFKAGMAYFQIPRYGDAINAFESVVKQFPSSERAVEAMFMISRCHAGRNNIREAVNVLEAIAVRAPDQDDRDRARFESGRLKLESGDLSGARLSFDKITPGNRRKYNVEQILRDMDDPGRIPAKSPFLAGMFSIVPGGGYLYCGRYREAATAFFLTIGLAAASLEAFDNDMYAMGGLVGLAGAGFYGGGAIGAVSSAHKYNRKSYSDYIQQHIGSRREPGFSLGIGSDSVMVSFHWRF
ncbi:MAG: tetratricopeptide repeat protein [Desulfobacteraceae bacterium]|nr:tetratricopeptide repeat protein [Desulfobacteraceae bacterium]